MQLWGQDQLKQREPAHWPFSCLGGGVDKVQTSQNNRRNIALSSLNFTIWTCPAHICVGLFSIA